MEKGGGSVIENASDLLSDMLLVQPIDTLLQNLHIFPALAKYEIGHQKKNKLIFSYLQKLNNHYACQSHNLSPSL